MRGGAVPTVKRAEHRPEEYLHNLDFECPFKVSYIKDLISRVVLLKNDRIFGSLSLWGKCSLGGERGPQALSFLSLLLLGGIGSDFSPAMKSCPATDPKQWSQVMGKCLLKWRQSNLFTNWLAQLIFYTYGLKINTNDFSQALKFLFSHNRSLVNFIVVFWVTNISIK